MIQLYHAGGAGDFTTFGPSVTREQTRTLLENAKRLLRARGNTESVELLSAIPFQILEATNNFGDLFSVLHAVVPLERYESLRRNSKDRTSRQFFANIADVVNELGTPIRFIAAELALEPHRQPESQSDRGLRQTEINKLVYRYIGVSGGYLGDFSYRTHHDFYIDLDLDINPSDYDGTTRQKFIKILTEAPAAVQATILEGILRKYPATSSELRTQKVFDEIQSWINRLRGSVAVEPPRLRITSAIVERALSDAEELLRSRGAVSGVDRVHTALHGYIRALCNEVSIPLKDDSTLTELFKQMREQHPAFQQAGPRFEDVSRILRTLSTIVDTLNPLRNRASVAHPNVLLLAEPEAMLVINSVRTILHYIDEKIRHANRTSPHP